MKNYKCNASAKEFSKGTRTSILSPLLEEAYSYTFQEKPNYNKLIFMIEKIILGYGFIPDNKFFWLFEEGEQSKRTIKE